MKLSKLAVAMGLGMSLVCGVANAGGTASGTVTPATGDQGHGHVTFTGSIIDAPCSVSPESSDMEVPLGEVASSALKDGGESKPVTFNIQLQGCDVVTGKSVQVTWGGASDANASAADNMLGISGNASGAGIKLKDASAKEVVLGTPTTAQKLLSGNNIIMMSAYLKGDGQTVVPGDFTGSADFTLSYQ